MVLFHIDVQHKRNVQVRLLVSGLGNVDIREEEDCGEVTVERG